MSLNALAWVTSLAVVAYWVEVPLACLAAMQTALHILHSYSTWEQCRLHSGSLDAQATDLVSWRDLDRQCKQPPLGQQAVQLLAALTHLGLEVPQRTACGVGSFAPSWHVVVQPRVFLQASRAFLLNT